MREQLESLFEEVNTSNPDVNFSLDFDISRPRSFAEIFIDEVGPISRKNVTLRIDLNLPNPDSEIAQLRELLSSIATWLRK